MRAFPCRILVQFLDVDAVVHERPVPCSRVLSFSCRLHNRQYLAVFYSSVLQNTGIEVMNECSANVCFYQHIWLVKSKNPHGVCRIWPHSGEAPQSRLVLRNPTLTLRNNYFCRIM